MKLPDTLRLTIHEEAEKAGSAAVVRAANELSRRYRRAAGTPRMTAVDALAYVVARLPATYAANRHAMEKMARRMGIDRVTSLLDLGGGPGTSAWAAAHIFPSLERITILERDVELAALGQRLAQSSEHPAVRAAEWRREAIGSASLPSADLVTLSFVAGEMLAGQLATLLQAGWKAAQLAALVIEPGTPRGFSAILQARGFFLQHGHLLAPCPHALECPLAAEGDWCHFAERVERTSLHRRAKQAVLGYEDEKFSYVAAAKYPAGLPAARIVRHPRIHSGHVQLHLCRAGRHDRITVGRSQKQLYRAARSAEWGDEWPEED